MRKPKDPELLAIWTIVNALKTIDHSGRERVLQWAFERFVRDVKPEKPVPDAR